MANYRGLNIVVSKAHLQMEVQGLQAILRDCIAKRRRPTNLFHPECRCSEAIFLDFIPQPEHTILQGTVHLKLNIVRLSSSATGFWLLIPAVFSRDRNSFADSKGLTGCPCA